MKPPLAIPPSAWLGIAAIGLIWGGSFLANGLALPEISVTTLITIRVGGAALLLWPWVLFRRLAVPRGWRAWGALAVAALLNNVLPFQLIAWGQLHIDSGLAGILNSTTALFGVITAALFFHDERMTLRKLGAVALGFAGVVIILGADSLLHLDLTSLAQLSVLAASPCYALGAVWIRFRLGGVAPEVATAGMATMAALILFPGALAIDGLPQAVWSARAFGAGLYLAVFSSGLAYILYYRLLPRIGAGNIQISTLLIPPVAITLGVLFLGEELAASTYLGFGVLLLGLLILGGWLGRARNGLTTVRPLAQERGTTRPDAAPLAAHGWSAKGAGGRKFVDRGK